MITKETAIKIFNAHNEIENAKKLITNMAEVLRVDAEKTNPTLYNAFGERRGLQLGVPSGENSHRLFNVSADLSVKIIEDHIKQQVIRLNELMAIAKIELNASGNAPE